MNSFWGSFYPSLTSNNSVIDRFIRNELLRSNSDHAAGISDEDVFASGDWKVSTRRNLTMIYCVFADAEMRKKKKTYSCSSRYDFFL